MLQLEGRRYISGLRGSETNCSVPNSGLGETSCLDVNSVEDLRGRRKGIRWSREYENRLGGLDGCSEGWGNGLFGLPPIGRKRSVGFAVERLNVG